MAENEQGQEKTEAATSKRRDDARTEGNVPRSRELSTAVMLLGCTAVFYLFGGYIVEMQSAALRDSFTISRTELMDPLHGLVALQAAIAKGLLAFAPIAVVTVVLAAAAPLAVGGWSFSTKALAAKWNRIDPIKGLGRVFSVRGLIELLKALGKFGLILSFALTALYFERDALLMLGLQEPMAAMGSTAAIALRTFTLVVLATAIIAALDLPFQLWDHGRKLRMSRDEVKREMKDTEGSPELRGRIRAMQQEMASRRMMEEVPKADVVVTNPSHYAVALKFDPDTMRAPRVLAKGADEVAARIREVARASRVPVLSAPPLARSLFHTTRLRGEIPDGLYLAVAQVLAYVFQLRRLDGRTPPPPPRDLPIPPDLEY